MNRPENVDFVLKDIKSNILDNYVCFLEQKIDKAIEYNKEVLTWTTNEPITDEIAYKNLEILGDKENTITLNTKDMNITGGKYER